MAGYSGTPLAKKLGIKVNFRAALLHLSEDVKTELRDVSSGEPGAPARLDE